MQSFVATTSPEIGEKRLISRKRRNRLLIASLAVALLLLLVYQLPRLLDVHRVELDFRNFYLVFRLQEPELYPGHSLGTLERASPVYTAILWTAGRLIMPEMTHKLLPFPLLLISVYFMFRIGERLANAGTGAALAIGFTVFNLASNTEVAVSGGLQRSFAVPLLVALVWAMMQRRLAAMLAIVLLSGVIYLPILPVAALAVCLALVLRYEDGRWRLAPDWRKLAPLAVVALVVGAALLPFLMERVLGNLTHGLEALRNGRHMLLDPVYQRGGRYPLFVWFPITGRLGFVSGANTFMQVTLLGVMALIIVWVRGDKRRRLPAELSILLAASLTAFVLSWLAIILTSSTLLYLPSRHTESSFFIVLVTFVFLNLENTLRDVAALLQRKRRLLLTASIPLLLLGSGASLVPLLRGAGAESDGGWQLLRLMLLGLCLALAPILWLYWKKAGNRAPGAAREAQHGRLWPLLGGFMILLAPVYIVATGPPSYRPADSELALFDYLRTLPTDAVIAGDPCSLDDVLFYARRNALYSCWNAEENPDALVAGLDAYYAESAAPILAFCRSYGVDVLVVNEQTVTADHVAQGRVIYEPYQSALAKRLAERSAFVLAQVPPAQRLFQSGSRYVVACTPEGLTFE